MRSTESPLRRSPARKSVWKVLSWALLIASLAMVVHFLWQSGDALRALSRIGAPSIAALFAMHLVYLVTYGYRYLVVLEKCSARSVGFRPWFRIYVLGQFLNLAVPQLGSVYRGLSLKKEFDISYTRYITGFFSVAWLSAGMNMALALVAIVVLQPDLTVGQIPAYLIPLAIGLVVVAAPPMGSLLLAAVKVRLASFSWVQSKLSEVLQVSLSNCRDLRYLLTVAGLGLLLLIQASVIFGLIFSALGIPVAVAALILFYVILQVGTYISLTPGNLGVQELAFGVLASQLGIGIAEGVLASLFLRTTGYVSLLMIVLPIGGLGVFRETLRISRASRSEKLALDSGDTGDIASTPL